MNYSHAKCVLSSWGPQSCQRSSKATFWRTWWSWLSWRTLSSSCTRYPLKAPAQALPTTCFMIWNEPWPLASTPSISPLPRAPLSDHLSDPVQDFTHFGLLCHFGFIAGPFWWCWLISRMNICEQFWHPLICTKRLQVCFFFLLQRQMCHFTGYIMCHANA